VLQETVLRHLFWAHRYSEVPLLEYVGSTERAWFDQRDGLKGEREREREKEGVNSIRSESISSTVQYLTDSGG